MARGTALLTAAAHRRGKALVAALAGAGFDVAIGSLAKLASRVGLVEAHGRQGLALRFNVNDPQSVALALREIESELGAPSLLVHVAPHELVGPPERLDACTAALLPALRARRGAVLYLLDPGDPFPEAPAAREQESGVWVAGLRCPEEARPETVAGAALRLLDARERVEPGVHAF